MKIKITILCVLVIISASSMAQTVKWWAGKENKIDNDANLNFNNTNNISNENVWFHSPEGITWDKKGNMWISERNKIRLYNGTFSNRAGGFGDVEFSHGYTNATGIQSRFFAPSGIVTDVNDVIFIADDENHAIRRMDAFSTTGNGQVVSTFAGALPVSFTGTSGSTDGMGTSARFNNPKGMVRDANGNFYVAEWSNFCIRKISSAGAVSVLAGKITVTGSKDGTGSTAEFAGPYGIAILDNNYLVVSDKDNGTIRKVHMTTGVVTTICGLAGDNLYADGTLAQARFRSPRGIAVVDGKIYVADESVIRVIDVAGNSVSTFAGSKSTSGNQDGEGENALFGTLGAIAYDGKITLYVTDLYYNVIKTVRINSLAPTVDFSANKTGALVDEVITLTNTSAGKPATSLLWTITSTGLSQTIVTGNTASLTPIGVKFHAAGFYNINLDVTNAYGNSSKYKGSFISVSTTGIKLVPENIVVGVYPNPSSGIFTVQSLYGNFPIQSFEITDLAGRVILSKECANVLSESFILNFVPNGLYFMKVKTSSGYSSLKLQKN